MIDTSKWHHQTLLPNGISWWNGEQQHYTNSITNSYQNNDFLALLPEKKYLQIRESPKTIPLLDQIRSLHLPMEGLR